MLERMEAGRSCVVVLTLELWHLLTTVVAVVVVLMLELMEATRSCVVVLTLELWHLVTAVVVVVVVLTLELMEATSSCVVVMTLELWHLLPAVVVVVAVAFVMAAMKVEKGLIITERAVVLLLPPQELWCLSQQQWKQRGAIVLLFGGLRYGQ